jgi:hypothetical protein
LPCLLCKFSIQTPNTLGSKIQELLLTRTRAQSHFTICTQGDIGYKENQKLLCSPTPLGLSASAPPVATFNSTQIRFGQNFTYFNQGAIGYRGRIRNCSLCIPSDTIGPAATYNSDLSLNKLDIRHRLQDSWRLRSCSRCIPPNTTRNTHNPDSNSKKTARKPQVPKNQLTPPPKSRKQKRS